MGIAEKSLKSLIGKLKTGVDFSALVDALAVSFERLRVFLRGILTESCTGTAVDTLEEWYEQLGISYDPSQTTEVLQARAKQAQTSVGESNINYLNTQIQISYPDVFLEEVFIEPEFMAGAGMAGLMQASDYPSWLTPAPTDGTYPNFYYRVLGEVDTTYDLFGIQNLLDHIMPAPYEPVFAVTILNLTPTAMAGLGMTGLMMAGRID